MLYYSDWLGLQNWIPAVFFLFWDWPSVLQTAVMQKFYVILLTLVTTKCAVSCYSQKMVFHSNFVWHCAWTQRQVIVYLTRKRQWSPSWFVCTAQMFLNWPCPGDAWFALVMFLVCARILLTKKSRCPINRLPFSLNWRFDQLGIKCKLLIISCIHSRWGIFYRIICRGPITFDNTYKFCCFP